MDTVFYHIRPDAAGGGQWSGPGHVDNDGDRLPTELEEAVGTCDVWDVGLSCSSSIGKPGGVRRDGTALVSCYDYCTWIDFGTPADGDAALDYDDRWRSSDTDNDGLDDFAEIYASVTYCTGAPSPPFWKVTTCDPEWTTQTRYAVPLSVFEPAPDRYDVFLEADAVRVATTYEGVLPHDHVPKPAQNAEMERIYEVEGTTCWITGGAPATCPGDPFYSIDVHVEASLGDTLPYDMEMDFHGAEYAFGWFNRLFRPARKYTRTFHYGVLSHAGGGQSTYGTLIAGTWNGSNSFPLEAGAVLAHELGHSRGLSHSPGDSYDNYFSPYYASLMDYGYNQYAVGQYAAWPSDAFSSCTSHANCTGTGYCELASGHPLFQQCRPFCGNPQAIDGLPKIGTARFSRGLMGKATSPPQVVEACACESGFCSDSPTCNDGVGNTDVGYADRTALALSCYGRNQSPPGAPEDLVRGPWRMGRPAANNVNIDFDASSTYSTAPIAWDLDGFGGSTPTATPSRDQDDWKHIYRSGFAAHLKDGDRHQRRFHAYLGEFNEAGLGTDLSGWANVVTITGGPTFMDWFAKNGLAVLFSGAGSTQFIRVQNTSSNAIRSLGDTVANVPPDGFRVEALIDALPYGPTERVIFSSSLFELKVVFGTTLRLWGSVQLSPTSAFLRGGPLISGMTRVIMEYRRGDDTLKIRAEPVSGTASESSYEVPSDLSPVNLQEVLIGGDGGSTRTFLGLIDDVVITRWEN